MTNEFHTDFHASRRGYVLGYRDALEAMRDEFDLTQIQRFYSEHILPWQHEAEATMPPLIQDIEGIPI